MTQPMESCDLLHKGEKTVCFIREKKKSYLCQQKARLLVFKVLDCNIFIVFFKATNQSWELIC